jgi:hypothetical protein
MAKIAELKKVDGKLCVFLDFPSSDEGELRIQDAEEIERFRKAISDAIEVLESVSVGNTDYNRVNAAIVALCKLPH